MIKMILSIVAAGLLFANFAAAQDVDNTPTPIMTWGTSPADIITQEGQPDRQVLKYAKTYGDLAVIVSYFFDGQDRLFQVTVAADEPTQAQIDALKAALARRYEVSKDEKTRFVCYDGKTVIELRWKGANWLLTYQARGK